MHIGKNIGTGMNHDCCFFLPLICKQASIGEKFLLLVSTLIGSQEITRTKLIVNFLRVLKKEDMVRGSNCLGVCIEAKTKNR